MSFNSKQEPTPDFKEIVVLEKNSIQFRIGISGSNFLLLFCPSTVAAWTGITIVRCMFIIFPAIYFLSFFWSHQLRLVGLGIQDISQLIQITKQMTPKMYLRGCKATQKQFTIFPCRSDGFQWHIKQVYNNRKKFKWVQIFINKMVKNHKPRIATPVPASTKAKVNIKQMIPCSDNCCKMY